MYLCHFVHAKAIWLFDYKQVCLLMMNCLGLIYFKEAQNQTFWNRLQFDATVFKNYFNLFLDLAAVFVLS